MPRKLDFNTNSKYPTVVSQKDLHKKKNVLIVPNLITEIEGVTEEIPNMNDFENDASTDDDLIVDELTEVTNESTLESVLEMENFELSDKEDNIKDSDEDDTTLDPVSVELEITTILN